MNTVQYEAWRLRVIGLNNRYPTVNEQRELANYIRAAKRADGTMLVEERGRDCDGVQYAGQVHGPIPATFAAFWELRDDIAEWADGPFYLRPIKADAEVPTYTSRDLTLEAFENGHPHSIHA